MLNKLRFYDQIRQLIIDDNNEKHWRLYRHEMIILLIEFIRIIGYLFICFKDISLLETLASYDPTVKLIFGNVLHSNMTLHYYQHKIENCRVTALTLAIGILYIIQSQYVIYFNDYRLIGFTSVYDFTVRNMDLYRSCLLFNHHRNQTDDNHWTNRLSFWSFIRSINHHNSNLWQIINIHYLCKQLQLQINFKRFKRIRMPIIPYISGEHKILLVLSVLIIHDYSIITHLICFIVVMNFNVRSFIHHLMIDGDSTLFITFVCIDLVNHFYVCHILVRNSIIYLNMATISQAYLLKRLRFLNHLMFRISTKQLPNKYGLNEFLFQQFRRQLTYICSMIHNSNHTIWANVILFALISNLPINIMATYRILYRPMNMQSLMLHILFVNVQILTIILTLFPMAEQNRLMHRSKRYMPRMQMSLERSNQIGIKIKTLEMYERLTSSKQQFGFSIGRIHIINHKYFFEILMSYVALMLMTFEFFSKNL
ncbi:hypothetical protein DERF_011650 [Dermatophagoides farinae]|uniref:Uncharacterized protein n=1 Tax=Dermatophagoides farinae TaxID=6954 RepID=A0A922HUY8_DERFA|nr:hypothetical protein HUG17_10051 [Dermatophagoides farinae]KAH9506944.1 hypothetical protein DERF_011650 [Dermatophagoides farinae]